MRYGRRSHVPRWQHRRLFGQLKAEKFVPGLDLPTGYIPGPGEDDGVDLTVSDLPDDFVAPGAVAVRPQNWDLEAKPFATYRLASGDTFSGLAATYLGDRARWREIYQTGRNQQEFPNPDVLTHAGPLDMPNEARDRMKAFLKKGQPPGELPGDIPPGEVKKLTRSKTPFIVAGAVAVAATVAIVIAVA